VSTAYVMKLVIGRRWNLSCKSAANDTSRGPKIIGGYRLLL